MPRKENFWNDVKSLIGFFTIIPVKSESFPTARGLYFLSTLGLILGAIAGLIFFETASHIGSVSAVILYLAFITAISGFHHLDSVLDVGDALMAKGNRDRMIEVMKDPVIGTGGIGMFLVVYGTTAAFALSLTAVQAMSVLAISEAVSKLSFITSAHGRKPLGSGMGSSFIGSVSKGGSPLLLANFAVPILISIFLGVDFLIPIFLALLTSLAITGKIEKMLSGINGDVIGFSGEISRMIYIVAFVLLFLL